MGDVVGDEDLLIEGHISGSVTFGNQHMNVAASGGVEADIVAQSLTVVGRVHDRFIAAKSIKMVAGAQVEGKLHLPGLVIEDGAVFHGTLDMNPYNSLLADTTAARPAPRRPWPATHRRTAKSTPCPFEKTVEAGPADDPDEFEQSPA